MKKNLPMVRLSDKERLIVQYIVGQLEAAYRNSAGKPVYARNMDQVIKDIFGIKKFTKTLARARVNEGLMIQLMKTMDTETLWRITRSKEHYGLLCSLVALDHQIVKMGKRYNNMLEMEPGERPVNKMKKLAKNIKKSKKMYRSCIRTFTEIFEIEKVSKDGGTNDLMNNLANWLDRHDRDDDIFSFDYEDYGYSGDVLDSMDAFVSKKMRTKKNPRANVRVGALDLFDNSDDIFSDDEYEDDEEDDEEDDSIDADGLARAILKACGGDTDVASRLVSQLKNGGGRSSQRSRVNPDLEAILDTIKDGFGDMADAMNGIYDMLSGEQQGSGDDGYFVEHIPGRPVPTGELSREDIIRMSNPETEDTVNGETGDDSQNPPYPTSSN